MLKAHYCCFLKVCLKNVSKGSKMKINANVENGFPRPSLSFLSLSLRRVVNYVIVQASSRTRKATREVTQYVACGRRRVIKQAKESLGVGQRSRRLAKLQQQSDLFLEQCVGAELTAKCTTILFDSKCTSKWFIGAQVGLRF